MLISIITPTYNRAHTLPRAIASVLNQSYSNWELIIVDDASTDQTADVISGYADGRIRYTCLVENKGNAGARNAGVQLARGEFITFIDSDDEFEPTFLEVFVKHIEERSTAFNFGFCGYTIVEDSGKTRQYLWQPNRQQSFLENLQIGIGCGVMIRKTCFDKAGYFDERLRVAVDTDWLIRLERDFEYDVIPAHLVRIHFHKGDRVRKSTTKLLEAYKIIFEKNKTLIRESPAICFRFLYKLQWLHYHAGLVMAGNQYFYQLKRCGHSFNKKAVFLFLLFNLLPQTWALRIHKRHG